MRIAQWVVGSLAVATGLLAVAVGLMAASAACRSARRNYQRTAARCGVTREGWDAWFVSGFSDVTMGLRWLRALAAWVIWTLAGAGFIGVGLHLVSHT